MHWLTQNIHVSWLVAITAASFVCGVWSCLYVAWPPALWIIGFGCIGITFVKRKTWTVIFLIFGGLAVGNWYGGATRDQQAIISPLYGQTVALSGIVREDISRDSKNGVKVQLHKLIIDQQTIEGSVWISGTTKAELLRGDRLRITGELQQGFGTFSAVMYRASIIAIERETPGDIGRVVRDGFADNVRKGISEPQASLGVGYLTGQKSALPEDLSEALQIAGLTHIVVASGYNLTILVRLARKLFIRWSKYLSAISAGMMIVCFVAVTGLSPSMTRAGIVSGFSLLAWYYGRAFHPFVLLPFVAAITVVWQPSYAWGDLGWQLSFAAFAGVMVVAPLIQRYFFGRYPPGILRQVLGETIAAHLVTLPITVGAFSAVSHVAIVANVMIVPLVPLAMLLTFIVGCTAMILPEIVYWVGLPAQWLLGYMTHVAMWLSELPWAQMQVTPPAWILVLYIALLVLACVYMQRVTKFQLREVNPIE
jgi:competence protein ComEC